MNIHLKLNGKDTDLVVIQDESLLTALRRAGIWSVKHGCENRRMRCLFRSDGWKISPYLRHAGSTSRWA